MVSLLRATCPNIYHPYCEFFRPFYLIGIIGVSLLQLGSVAFCPFMVNLWEEPGSLFSIILKTALWFSFNLFPKVYKLNKLKPLSLSPCTMCSIPWSLWWPSTGLASIWLSFSLLGSSRWDKMLQMQSHQCWIAGNDHLALSAASAFNDSAQYVVGLHFCKDALQANVPTCCPPPPSVLFCRAAFLSSWSLGCWVGLLHLSCRTWHFLFLNFLRFLSDHPTLHCL